MPDSCCLSDVEGCGKGILSMAADQVPKIIHPNGCLSELKEVIEGNVAALGGVGVGIAVIQVSSYTTHCQILLKIWPFLPRFSRQN